MQIVMMKSELLFGNYGVSERILFFENILMP